MKKIDFMTGTIFKEDGQDIKLLTIAPNGNILLTTKRHDNEPIKSFIDIPYYEETKKCYFHADNIQVLINRYLKDNPKYQDLKKQVNKDNNASITYSFVHRMLSDGYIVFYNSTSDNIQFYQLHGKHGNLYINYQTITKEQQESIKELENYLKDFNEISIDNYIDYTKNYCQNYLVRDNGIYKTLFSPNIKKK